MRRVSPHVLRRNGYEVLEAANGQPPRLVLELEEVDRTAFVQSLAPENRPELRPAIAEASSGSSNRYGPSVQLMSMSSGSRVRRDGTIAMSSKP